MSTISRYLSISTHRDLETGDTYTDERLHDCEEDACRSLASPNRRNGTPFDTLVNIQVYLITVDLGKGLL